MVDDSNWWDHGGWLNPGGCAATAVPRDVRAARRLFDQPVTLSPISSIYNKVFQSQIHHLINFPLLETLRGVQLGNQFESRIMFLKETWVRVRKVMSIGSTSHYQFESPLWWVRIAWMTSFLLMDGSNPTFFIDEDKREVKLYISHAGRNRWSYLRPGSVGVYGLLRRLCRELAGSFLASIDNTCLTCAMANAFQLLGDRKAASRRT